MCLSVSLVVVVGLVVVVVVVVVVVAVVVVVVVVVVVPLSLLRHFDERELDVSEHGNLLADHCSELWSC